MRYGRGAQELVVRGVAANGSADDVNTESAGDSKGQ